MEGEGGVECYRFNVTTLHGEDLPVSQFYKIKNTVTVKKNVGLIALNACHLFSFSMSCNASTVVGVLQSYGTLMVFNNMLNGPM